MKVAGRKIVGSTSTSAERRLQLLERLLDVARDLQRVGAELLLDDQQQARAVVDDASPIGGGKPSTTVGHVAEPQRRAVARTRRRSRSRSRALRDRRRVRDGEPLVRRVDEAARPAATRRRRAAATTSSSVTPCARSRSGSTSTWNCRSRWPQIATLATPGIAISRGRIVHCASVVSSICDSVFDVMPIFSTRLSDDSGDSITGGRATAGSCGRGARQPLLHELPRRASGRVLGSRISTTDDRPSTDFERIVVEPGHAVERVLERHA